MLACSLVYTVAISWMSKSEVSRGGLSLVLCSLPSNRFFSGPPRDETCARAAAFWYVAALRRAAEWILGVAVGLAVAVLIMLLIGIFTRVANAYGPSHQCEGTERRR